MSCSRPVVPPRIIICFIVAWGVFRPAAILATDEGPPQRSAPSQTGGALPPTAIIPLDEVRIRMRGYGLTVFEGTKIEPFPVEVVTIMAKSHETGPVGALIWIRSTEPRLVKSGPVRGMSGSPIYLWDSDEPQELGRGGRLMGAFAWGYPLVKECLAGVEPIEPMRQLAKDAHDPAHMSQPNRPEADPNWARRLLNDLQRMASARQLTPIQTLRLDTIQRVFKQYVHKAGAGTGSPSAADVAPRPVLPLNRGPVRPVHAMRLPMDFGSPIIAELCRPFLEPMGIAPIASGVGLVHGKPPVGIDPAKTVLAPGSVLSIPLVFGDMDLAAAGTVTEVFPDGTVLGLGHAAFFGAGRTALPLATGYVHYVIPRIDISSRVGGSLRIHGTIVQDRRSGVAGVGETSFTTAPINLRIDMPGQPRREYAYQILDHPRLSPFLAATVVMLSATADQQLPIEHTLHLSGSISFSGGRTLQIDSHHPGAGLFGVIFELLPIVAAMMNNSFEKLNLVSMPLVIDIEPVQRSGSMVQAVLERAEVEPGDTVQIAVKVQPYQQPLRTYRLQIEVPPNLPEGDYQLHVTNAASYANLLLNNRPHLAVIGDIDDLVETVQQLISIQRNAIYAVLMLPEHGLAVGRQALPQLPSSRRAILTTPTNTLAVPFADTIEDVVQTDVVIDGEFAFTINVRK